MHIFIFLSLIWLFVAMTQFGIVSLPDIISKLKGYFTKLRAGLSTRQIQNSKAIILFSVHLG